MVDVVLRERVETDVILEVALFWWAHYASGSGSQFRRPKIQFLGHSADWVLGD